MHNIHRINKEGCHTRSTQRLHAAGLETADEATDAWGHVRASGARMEPRNPTFAIVMLVAYGKFQMMYGMTYMGESG